MLSALLVEIKMSIENASRTYAQAYNTIHSMPLYSLAKSG